MKRAAILFAAILFAASAFAQELQTKIFQVHNRDARSIYAAVLDLSSGNKDSRLSYNEDLHTITVRDLPENIAVIGQAIDRLDQPAPKRAAIEMKISVLIGSTAPVAGVIPEDLAPVIKQLQSTLRYAHYGLLTANIHRTEAGGTIEAQGTAEATVLGLPQNKQVRYDYDLRGIDVDTSGDRPSVSVKEFEFHAFVPGTMYSAVLKTPVTIGSNEKVVIGTTTLGDKALIVVVTAKAEK